MSHATSNYRIYTRTHGVHEVVAQTARHAVAAIVARIGLTEQETACVVKWSVVKNKEEKQGEEK